MKSYRQLPVWIDAMQFVTHIYIAARKLPSDETYGLISQIRRAAVSIPSNIAEGAARKNTKELLQFLNVAQGSKAEVETHVLICQNLGYLDSHTVDDLLQKSASIGKQLSGLRNALLQKIH